MRTSNGHIGVETRALVFEQVLLIVCIYSVTDLHDNLTFEGHSEHLKTASGMGVSGGINLPDLGQTLAGLFDPSLCDFVGVAPLLNPRNNLI